MTLKRLIVAVMLTALIFSFSAQAGDFSEREKSIGKTVSTIVRLPGTVLKTIFSRPTGILGVRKRVRQEIFDITESTVRAVAGSEAIEDQQMGSVNSAIQEAGVDWLVDATVYGVATGIIDYNDGSPFTGHEVGQSILHGLGAGASTAAADLVYEETGGDEDNLRTSKAEDEQKGALARSVGVARTGMRVRLIRR